MRNKSREKVTKQIKSHILYGWGIEFMGGWSSKPPGNFFSSKNMENYQEISNFSDKGRNDLISEKLKIPW